MIESYDVKEGMRKSDVIFYMLNGFHGRKISGMVSKTEFADNLINIGDIFANQVRKGKVSKETVESYKSHISQFSGENKDKYFAYPHEGLDRVYKTTNESIYFAEEEAEKRNSYAQPVMDADSYDRTFRKLG